ncbi:MAG: hypothetical protein NUV93_00035 [Firmicutes bacterium]|nr:hypothetical protein [Bacillota bacterium]
MNHPEDTRSIEPARAGTREDDRDDHRESEKKIDFLSGEQPEALVRAARDVADLAAFAHSVSDNGQNPGKLIDAVKMLILIQEEEYATGAGVGGHIGLLNRFVERWGCQPKVDPVGFLNTGYRLSLIMRDVTVKLTTKGSRLLGSMHRILQDWYGFHMMSNMEQLFYQSRREMELMDAYEAHGYETRSLARALSFLEKAYRELSERLYDYIVEGMAIEQISSLLDRYDVLEEAIAGKQKEGYEPGLPIVERVERAKAGALQVAFDAMTGVLAHSQGRAMSEMNLISKHRFYSWLRDAFDSDHLLDLASEAGDLILPVYLPAHAGTAQLEEFVSDFVGRQVVDLEGPPPEEKQTSSEEGDLDDIEDEFEEDFAPYVDLVLTAVASHELVPEPRLIAERATWGEALMTAAAAGEVVTKSLARGAYSPDVFEEQRFEMRGQVMLSGKHGGDIRARAKPAESAGAGGG